MEATTYNYATLLMDDGLGLLCAACGRAAGKER